MLLILSALFFAVFTLNVIAGSFWNAQMFGDVGEMIVLLISSILFVAAILKKESDVKNLKQLGKENYEKEN